MIEMRLSFTTILALTWLTLPSRAAAQEEQRSMAVVPFADMGPEKDLECFSCQATPGFTH